MGIEGDMLPHFHGGSTFEHTGDTCNSLPSQLVQPMNLITIWFHDRPIEPNSLTCVMRMMVTEVGSLEGVEDLLVVDDNPAEIRLLEEAFNGSQFDPSIYPVTTKDEALDFMNQKGEYKDIPKPDVILLDWHLSTATGEEVLEAARSLDHPIPVVVMTGSKPELNALESSLPPDERYIEKQTDPEAYIEILRSYFATQ